MPTRDGCQGGRASGVGGSSDDTGVGQGCTSLNFGSVSGGSHRRLQHGRIISTGSGSFFRGNFLRDMISGSPQDITGRRFDSKGGWQREGWDRGTGPHVVRMVCTGRTCCVRGTKPSCPYGVFGSRRRLPGRRQLAARCRATATVETRQRVGRTPVSSDGTSKPGWLQPLTLGRIAWLRADLRGVCALWLRDGGRRTA
jgi:hypothetical protein